MMERWNVAVLALAYPISRNPDSSGRLLARLPLAGLMSKVTWADALLVPLSSLPRQSSTSSGKYTYHSFNCGRRLPLWQGWENLVEECLVVLGLLYFSAL